MLVAELQSVIEGIAPARLAQEWDNSRLQVGDAASEVSRILAALEVTDGVVEEAAKGSFDTILTHHPLIFTPMRSVTESRPREKLVRRLVQRGSNVISCHTNLDAAAGGIADIAADALGLSGTVPIEPASAGWVKFVGFIPEDAVEEVAAAVFAAGAGGIGKYSECAFAGVGTGWFRPGESADPAIGSVGRAERTSEVRWETVVPRERVSAVLRSYITEHPYEEPAFDVYPTEDLLPGLGLGRVGELRSDTTVRQLARTVSEVFEADGVAWSGSGDRVVRRVGVLPGSGRGSLERAFGRCEVLVTGDLGHHDGEQAAEMGLSLIDVPHGDVEWWAFKRWCVALGEILEASGVTVSMSEKWCGPWSR